MPERVLIAGCGYVGCRLAELLVDDGVAVWGLKRSPEGLPQGVQPITADVSDPGTLNALPVVDALVYAVSPAGRDADAYRVAYVDGLRNVLDALDQPVRVVLVSSTGVYGQADGRWVDETTPEESTDATAEQILAAEALATDRGAPGTSLRLGGIYGPGRTRTIRGVLEGGATCWGPEVYSNRIHRDDAARAARHLLALESPDPLYLGVDRDPAALRAVYAWIAEQAGRPDPCEGVPESDWQRQGWRGTNKRCSSQRLVDAGFGFEFPTFRDGYAPLIRELAES